MQVSEGLKKVTENSWSAWALMGAVSRDYDRPTISGLYMDARQKIAVATTGQFLFTSRQDFVPELGGKLLDAEAWIIRRETIESKATFPEWGSIVKSHTLDATGTLTVPAALPMICRKREVRFLFRPDQAPLLLEADELEQTQQEIPGARLLNARFLLGLTGKSVFYAWNSEEAAAPVWFCEQPLRSPILASDFVEQPWALVAMPMRF